MILGYVVSHDIEFLHRQVQEKHVNRCPCNDRRNHFRKIVAKRGSSQIIDTKSIVEARTGVYYK